MKIVYINKYIEKRDKLKMNPEYQIIVNGLKGMGQAAIKCTTEYAIELAEKILSKTEYYDGISTPIVRIAKDFDIVTYKTIQLDDNISGVMYAGGTTKEIYGDNNVVFLDAKEVKEHRRFILAHELGHYFFDCLCDVEYADGTKLFKATYPKQDHYSPNELLADAFAAEILMPRERFIKEYNMAMESLNNREFVIRYLSKFFETKPTSIKKRIHEVLY